MTPSQPKKRGRRGKRIAMDDARSTASRLYAIAVDRYFSGIKDKNERFRKLTDEEYAVLYEKFANDRRGLENELVTHNIFLAVNIASHYSYAYTDYDELLSAAMYGLVVASQKFDPKRGNRFSTCATWWIRKFILMPLYNCSYNKHVCNQSSLFLDSGAYSEGCEGRDNHNYQTLSDMVEPTVSFMYASSGKDAVERLEGDAKSESDAKLLSDIIGSIATSPLTSDDKAVFKAVFLDGKKVGDVADELGISRSAVMRSRTNVMSFISSRFKKPSYF